MTMSARALKALKGSIHKWEMICMGCGEDKTAENCPLCKLYIRGYFECSDACPVKKKTGEDQCRKTPYYRWKTSLVDISFDIPWSVIFQVRRHRNYACIEPAQDMLAFLYSLLPEEGE